MTDLDELEKAAKAVDWGEHGPDFRDLGGAEVDFFREANPAAVLELVRLVKALEARWGDALSSIKDARDLLMREAKASSDAAEGERKAFASGILDGFVEEFTPATPRSARPAPATT